MSSEESESIHEEQITGDVEQDEGEMYNKNESAAEEGGNRFGPLTRDMIANCISMPYRLGYGFSHAFVKLDCAGRSLNDIEVLRTYIHLRFIIISDNKINDISPVSVIGHLIYLKADNNAITVANCLNQLRFLQFLDLSYNQLTTINDLEFPLMQHLKVNDNLITRLTDSSGAGLNAGQFPTLQTLEIRGNAFKSIKGIENLQSLKSLYAGSNDITDLTEIGSLTSLVRAHLRENGIHETVGFAPSQINLEYINLRNNRIKRFTSLAHLSNLPGLKVLSLLENPITSLPDYRLKVIAMLPRLVRLDKTRITPDERSRSSNMNPPFDGEAFEEERYPEPDEEEMGLEPDEPPKKESSKEPSTPAASAEEEEEEEDI